MPDPLSDPRATRLLTAEPGEVAALAGAFRRVASEAANAAAGLRGADADATWTGGAADAFRDQLGKLPGDLARVEHSYGEVAGALDTYEPELASLRGQFQRLVSEIESARSSLAGAQSTLTSASGQLSAATSAPKATSTTPAVVQARSAVSAASGAVGRLQGEVDGLESAAFRVLDEFDTARGSARARVSSAAGIAPSESWLSGALGAIGNFVGGAGHVLAGAGHFLAELVVGVYDAGKALPGDIAAVIEHPGDLHDWAKLAGDLGTVAGAVALLAAIIVCPLDGFGLAGAAGLLETAGEAAGAVGIGADADKTIWDGELVLQGKERPIGLFSDALALGLAGYKLPGLRAAANDAALLSGRSSALESYGLSRALGASHGEALAALSEDQRLLITKSASKLANPARLQYLRATAVDRVDAAEQLVNRMKALDEAAHYSVERGLEVASECLAPSQNGGSNGG